MFFLGLYIPRFLILSSSSLPECCPNSQYINNSNVCLLEGSLFITLKSQMVSFLTLQRLKHVGFLYKFTSKYTRKHMRLMNFYKTFTTKDTIVSINDSIRLVSKPIYIFSFSNCNTT